MFFTHEDYIKIEKWLQARAVKDSMLPEAAELKPSDTIAILQNRENKTIPAYKLFNAINASYIPDLYNVSDIHRVSGISLEKAIHTIPVNKRKIGLIVTFINETNNWVILQFKGTSVNQWSDTSLWKELFESFVEDFMYHPDEEDISETFQGPKRVLIFKDRKYNEEPFSGKGVKILRKNLVGTPACSIDDNDYFDNVLNQSNFSEPHTIYIVRYDFTIDGNIVMPAGCELRFEGGTINGGGLDLNGCILSGIVGQESEYIKGTTVSNWHKGQIEYRDNTIKYWNGSSWEAIKGQTIDVSTLATKLELNNYALKKDTYTKTEVNNITSKFVTTSTHNADVSALNTRIDNLSNSGVDLDSIQRGINSGCNVNLPLPSSNDNKLSLPIWTGTKAEYDAIISKEDGITYNIID